MKKIAVLIVMVSFIVACGGGDTSEKATTSEESAVEGQGDNPSYDPKRGEGKFTTVDVGEKLDAAMADAGEKVYSVKCSSCHKLTDERLVGPGWAGVTTRRTAPWVMNFVTNTDEMIDKDPEVQAQLEICLVRMPNQNIADEDARALYEFMRKNDGVK